METLKKLLCLALLFWGGLGGAQECPEPLFPGNDDLVPVDTPISWTEVVGVSAYLIQIGTTPGGSEITTLTSTGQGTQFIPPRGLPENATIYVEIYIYNIFQNTTTRCVSYSFRTDFFQSPPGCTELASPEVGDTEIPVQADIRWNYSSTATEYLVSVSTAADGLLFEDTITDDLALRPQDYLPDGLPPETEIFVQITPSNRLGPATGCEPFSFTTGPLATLPTCSSMVYPADGAFNVPLLPTIQWDPVDGAEGYYVSMDTSPFFDDDPIYDRVTLTSTSFGISEFRPLDPNSVYFVRIVPFNEAGEAQGCTTISFYTIVGCGPYYDGNGELISFSPELTFPETVGICTVGSPTPLTATDPADGYRWYGFENINREVLLGEEADFIPPGPGEYRLEIYNELTDASGIPIECATSRIFTVTESEPAIIEGTRVELGAGTITIEVQVSGIGDYEFALSPDGPYQDSNRFSGLPIDTYRVYVRDRNGCGISEALVESDLTVEGFPKFFTPNGDGINDFWQFILPPSGINPIREVFIFDRYGTLLAQIGPGSAGWDGTYNGKPMPASDYWFRAVNSSNQVVQGHFSLKR